MKKLTGLIALVALLTACGNSPNNTNGVDTTNTVKESTSPHADTSNMMNDTTHKDSVVH